ncbi:unnamed protein product [Boreogadus saida]
MNPDTPPHYVPGHASTTRPRTRLHSTSPDTPPQCPRTRLHSTSPDAPPQHASTQKIGDCCILFVPERERETLTTITMLSCPMLKVPARCVCPPLRWVGQLCGHDHFIFQSPTFCCVKPSH